MHLQRLLALTALVAAASVAWSQIEMRPGASRSSNSPSAAESSSAAGGGVSQHSAPFSPSRQVELPDEFKAQSAGEQASKQAAQSVVQASETLDGTPKKQTNWLGGVFLALGAGLTLIIVGKVLLDKFAPAAPTLSTASLSLEEDEMPEAPADYVQSKL